MECHAGITRFRHFLKLPKLKSDSKRLGSMAETCMHLGRTKRCLRERLVLKNEIMGERTRWYDLICWEQQKWALKIQATLGLDGEYGTHPYPPLTRNLLKSGVLR